MPPVRSIEEQIKKMLESRLSDEELVPILKSEAERLKGLIQKYIEQYYASYEPSVYRRTNNLRNSVRVNTKVYNRSIDVYFDEDQNWDPGVINGPTGFVPILIDAGWRVKSDVWFAKKWHFGFYEGYHFIQSAIDEFERTNQYKLHIEVIITPHAHPDSDGFKLRKDHRDMYDNMGF